VTEERLGQPRSEEWGPVARFALAAGLFASTVSFALFVHLVSLLASMLVSAAWIAAGVVGRNRVHTPLGQAAALATLAGGIVSAIASIVLTAAGR
jgi:hypothetical protein